MTKNAPLPPPLPPPDASVLLRSARGTRALGRRWAASLQPGTVLALVGEMGAGKTCFVQGLADGLGVEQAAQQVMSPTYTLVNEYFGGRLPLVHVDFYRLTDAAAALALGLDEQLGRADGVTAVEWADHLPSLLPTGTIWLQFQFVAESKTTRRLAVYGAPLPPRVGGQRGGGRAGRSPKSGSGSRSRARTR